MKKPMVGIIMGSDSDLPVMKKAAEVLEDFGVPYELEVISAHRTPNEMVRYAKTASTRGIQVIIAGAGGSAHLPGMTASFTTLPVIGVPVEAKTLQGLDSLLSIVQMPPGVPVATVGINAAHNAGVLAIQILAIGNTSLLKKIQQYKVRLAVGVAKKSKKLSELGYAEYLKQMEPKS